MAAGLSFCPQEPPEQEAGGCSRAGCDDACGNEGAAKGGDARGQRRSGGGSGSSCSTGDMLAAFDEARQGGRGLRGTSTSAQRHIIIQQTGPHPASGMATVLAQSGFPSTWCIADSRLHTLLLCVGRLPGERRQPRPGQGGGLRGRWRQQRQGGGVGACRPELCRSFVPHSCRDLIALLICRDHSVVLQACAASCKCAVESV